MYAANSAFPNEAKLLVKQCLAGTILSCPPAEPKKLVSDVHDGVRSISQVELRPKNVSLLEVHSLERADGWCVNDSEAAPPCTPPFRISLSRLSFHPPASELRPDSSLRQRSWPGSIPGTLRTPSGADLDYRRLPNLQPNYHLATRHRINSRMRHSTMDDRSGMCAQTWRCCITRQISWRLPITYLPP